ncbi:MAG: ATP-binding protein [Acidobacteriota bacterium]|nr:ATP-binding protein [Acidobacteriota bacterium]
MRSQSFWLLPAVIALLAAMALTPSISVLQILATMLAVLAGALLGIWLPRRRKKPIISFSEQSDSATDLQPPQIFALGKLFEATLGGMREGLLVVDGDMRVVASNPAAFQLFTRSAETLQSQRLTELTRNPAIYGAFLGALKGEERSGVKVETHGPDRRIFDLRVVPLQASDGKVVQGAIGVFFDITKLERLEHVRQEFLSNVSHELRTPLTAILAFVETLEGGDISEADSQRFLAIIRRNATRMHGLIDDILELSAIEAGNIQVKTEEIPLQHLVNDVITSLNSGALTRQVVLENTVGNNVRVFADPRRLEQMLTNLVDNAIKFNREGGRVTVRYENGTRDRIFVDDTGEGIPAQHLQRLFERFYRVDRARSRELGGTGLGLAIVKHLARAHGGEVAVESRLGEGSSFAIELPRK